MRTTRWLLGLAATAALAGASLPKLPADHRLPQSGDSPGVVVFSHAAHVDEKHPGCTSCHPKLFRMLEPSAPARGGRITHQEMEAGRQCGACHDGKAARGLEDCAACHRDE